MSTICKQIKYVASCFIYSTLYSIFLLKQLKNWLKLESVCFSSLGKQKSPTIIKKDFRATILFYCALSDSAVNSCEVQRQIEIT